MTIALKLTPDQHVIFTLHGLRHAILKHVANKFKLYATQELSEAVSVNSFYRYSHLSFKKRLGYL